MEQADRGRTRAHGVRSLVRVLATVLGAWLVVGPFPGPGHPAPLLLRLPYAVALVAVAWWATRRPATGGSRAEPAGDAENTGRRSPEAQGALTAAAAFLPAWAGFTIIGADHAAADGVLTAFVAGLVHLDHGYARRRAHAARGDEPADADPAADPDGTPA